VELEEKLSGALQENVLTLLCFDDDSCKLVRNTISPTLFESSVFRDIASHAATFVDEFGKAVKEHLPDVLEHVLKGQDRRKATLYSQVLENLYQAKDHVNRDYTVSKLQEFVRLQNLKGAVIEAVDALKNGSVADAEVILEKGLKNRVLTFDQGTVFSDVQQSLRFLDHQNDRFFMTGIKVLDDRDAVPRQGEMWLGMAPAKRGKSWLMVHMGKMAMLQRLPTVHISLEMSEDQVSQRYIQSFFAISKRDAKVRLPEFRRDAQGIVIDVAQIEHVRDTLRDAGIRDKLITLMKERMSRRAPFVIKRFPTRALTMSGLQAYLDSLERHHKLVPKVMIIDYPDLMKISSENKRIDTGVVYEELRGLAIERNFALICPTQGNRESANAKLVTDIHSSEDYSKIMTADTVVTYSQTPEERKLGLARLFVSNARSDVDKFIALITQNYAIGQFCLDSEFMLDGHLDMIDRIAGVKKDDDQ
jgi:replicative DNA helicase